jgi:hypothetical protein
MGASTVVWAAGCSSTSTPSNVDAGGSSSSSSGGGSSSSSGSSSGGGGADGQAAMDAGLQDATAEANTLGVLVDNMTAPTGTQNQMGNVDAGGAPIPAGETGGTYYTYLDPYSIGTISSALADVPVTPPVSEPDGSQIVGELCFKGSVTEYAGLGMNIVYQTKAPDASPAAPSAVEPFDASKYSGVSFYIYVYPLDGGQLPQLHFGIPDTQTAGPESWPASTCLDLPDGGDGDCYDDFGSDLIVTPGTWSQQSFAWSELTQGNWGAQYPLGLKTNQLIAMKWQANGPAADSGISELPFDFCISNIYFTP